MVCTMLEYTFVEKQLNEHKPNNQSKLISLSLCVCKTKSFVLTLLFLQVVKINNFQQLLFYCMRREKCLPSKLFKYHWLHIQCLNFGSSVANCVEEERGQPKRFFLARAMMTTTWIYRKTINQKWNITWCHYDSK